MCKNYTHLNTNHSDVENGGFRKFIWTNGLLVTTGCLENDDLESDDLENDDQLQSDES